MKIVERVAPRDHNLYISTDKHYGTILQHKKGIKKFIDTVKNDPIGYWVDLADIAEGIAVDDPRYCHYTIEEGKTTTTKQYEAYVEDHVPIADKLWTILEGNHDWKIGSKTGSLVESIVCEKLAREINVLPDSLYGTYSCKLKVINKKGNLMYKIFLTHGFGSINSAADDPVRREANMMLSLKRKLFRKAGDCIIMAMGHTHKLIVKPPISELYLTDDGTKTKNKYTSTSQMADFIPTDLRWYISAGCFYRLYEEGVSGYAERAGYDPNELGFIKCSIRNGIIKNVEKIIL